MDDLIVSHQKIPARVGGWYLGRDGSREAVARILSIDYAAESVVLTVVQAGHRWRRLAEKTRAVPVKDFTALLVEMKGEAFEPPAEYVAHPALGLGRAPLPAAGLPDRLKQVAELHPDAASEVAILARHGEGRPVRLAEEVAALTQVRLAWLLMGAGPLYEGQVPQHDWDFGMVAGGIVRRCRRCGLVDQMQGLSPRYCLGGERR